jgi:hypothetical protein
VNEQFDGRKRRILVSTELDGTERRSVDYSCDARWAEIRSLAVFSPRLPISAQGTFSAIKGQPATANSVLHRKMVLTSTDTSLRSCSIVSYPVLRENDFV